jgi:hypothetical protein
LVLTFKENILKCRNKVSLLIRNHIHTSCLRAHLKTGELKGQWFKSYCLSAANRLSVFRDICPSNRHKPQLGKTSKYI